MRFVCPTQKRNTKQLFRLSAISDTAQVETTEKTFRVDTHETHVYTRKTKQEKYDDAAYCQCTSKGGSFLSCAKEPYKIDYILHKRPMLHIVSVYVT